MVIVLWINCGVMPQLFHFVALCVRLSMWTKVLPSAASIILIDFSQDSRVFVLNRAVLPDIDLVFSVTPY